MMDFRLISYLSFLIAFQLLFVGLFLITNKKGNRRNNALFAIVFLLIAWNMVDLTLQVNEVAYKWGFLGFIDDGFFFLYGPLFYLYTKGVIFKDFKLSGKSLLHLIPYLLFTLPLLTLKDYTPNSTQEIMANDLPWQMYLVSALMYTHVFVYLAMAYKELWAYRNIIKNTYSQIEQMNLDWLSFALNTFAIITLISLIQKLYILCRQ